MLVLVKPPPLSQLNEAQFVVREHAGDGWPYLGGNSTTLQRSHPMLMPLLAELLAVGG